MSADPNIARCHPIADSELRRRSSQAHPVGGVVMHAQELHTSVDGAGRERVFRCHENIGRTYFLGTVGSEAEMIALDQASLAMPPGDYAACLPGDTCYRSDLRRYYRCISGYGLAAEDWEQLPADITAADLTDATAWGRAWLALADAAAAKAALAIAQSDVAGLVAALAGKWPTPANAATLLLIGQDGGAPTFNGAPWPSSGGGALTAHAMIMAAGPLAYYSPQADGEVLDADGDPATDSGDIAQATDLSGNGNHWIAPSGYRPTLDADGCGGNPCIAFGGSAHITSATGAVDLLDHTVVIVARSRASGYYGRLLVVGLPASGYDYNVATAEVITCDNVGDQEVRLNSGNTNYALSLTSAQIGRPAGWGVYVYRIGRPAALTGAASARLAVDGGLAVSTATTSYPTLGTGIHAGCQWRDGAAQPTTDTLTGDIALLAVLPRGMPDGWCDTLAGLLRAELGI